MESVLLNYKHSPHLEWRDVGMFSSMDNKIPFNLLFRFIQWLLMM